MHVERRVLANISRGPALVRVAWPDSNHGYFDKLYPVLTVQATETHATNAVIDEAFAAVVAALLVGRLCTLSLEGGHKLLAQVRSADDRVRTLIDRHPKFVEPVDEDPSSAPDDIRAIFARLAGVGAERFHQWWISDAAALKSAADGLQTDGPTPPHSEADRGRRRLVPASARPGLDG